MQGYYTQAGYWGYVPEERRYILFATERDYFEYIADDPN